MCVSHWMGTAAGGFVQPRSWGDGDPEMHSGKGGKEKPPLYSNVTIQDLENDKTDRFCAILETGTYNNSTTLTYNAAPCIWVSNLSFVLNYSDCPFLALLPVAVIISNSLLTLDKWLGGFKVHNLKDAQVCAINSPSMGLPARMTKQPLLTMQFAFLGREREEKSRFATIELLTTNTSVWCNSVRHIAQDFTQLLSTLSFPVVVQSIGIWRNRDRRATCTCGKGHLLQIEANGAMLG